VILCIEALAAGGDGVAREPDGRVIFVPFTAPGDRVEVALEPGGKRYARGRVRALLAAGPARTDPLCAVFGSCGGCSWQHVAYDAQVCAKRDILRETLARIGGLRLPAEIPFTPCPSPYAYRLRTRVVVSQGRVGYRRRRSNAVCATTRCPILVPALDVALERLAQHPPREDGEWELAAGEDGAVRATPLPDGAVRATPAPDGAVRATPAPARGAEAERLVLRAGQDRIARSPGVFAQSNALLLQALVAAVQHAAGSGTSCLELFAGAGFFTLGLARRFSQVVAVEGDPVAARDLVHNLDAAKIENVALRAGSVEAALAAWAQAAPDVVVLDPPRTGLARGLASRIADLGAQRVVYLSCDPATLARDLAELAHARYALTHVEGFDLFPQTPHLEALVVMERA
jgi:23S rRNA (uracil1939-C5)-methyltransferase